MVLIQIHERPEGQDGLNAIVSFENIGEYPISISDPFSQEEEGLLEWYFEEYLRFPFIRQIDAQNAAASITAYGETLFKQIFANQDAYASYREITRDGLSAAQFEIAGSPEFHRWHWEALKDPRLPQPIALQTSMIRKNLIPQVRRAVVRISPTINLLIVTARPHVEIDVGYRTISRPLVEGLRQAAVPIQIDILRPGTYRALVNHLEEVKFRHQGNDETGGYYHVIHFDVHGSLLTYEQLKTGYKGDSIFLETSYGRKPIDTYDDRKAFLFFESEQGTTSDPVEAGQLADLLINHQIPIAILNACQSGKQVGNSETSLGSRLMQAGMQLVLSMGYSVTVTAAELMMRTLYEQLFARRDLATAIRRARLELYNRKERRAYFNQMIPLEDWLLPVVYQNQAPYLNVREFTPNESAAYFEKQTQHYTHPQPYYGFVGRDLDMLQLEKRLLTRCNILLIRGMGGAGKTTFLHHVASWWQTTGLVDQVFYFGYNEKAWTCQQMLDTIARQLLSPIEYLRMFQPLKLNAQLVMLTQQLRSHRHLLILDNLESITGTQLTFQNTLPEEELARLHHFLKALRDGHTLVLLGSRGGETWLACETFDNNLYDLRGLDPEAASTLADRILDYHNATNYRQDEDLQQLLKLLDGFPLAQEVVLANLASQTPREVLAALQVGDNSLDKGSSQKKTESILSCIDYSYSNLSPKAQQLLLCLAPFTSVIFLNVLEQYSSLLKEQPILKDLPFEHLPEVIQETVKWGLLSPDPDIPAFLHLQPILPYFLRTYLHSPEQKEFRHAVEVAFRGLYDQLGATLYHMMESEDSQKRQIGLRLTGHEYENLLIALDLALGAHASVLSPYEALVSFLGAKRDQHRKVELSQKVLARMETYPIDILTNPLVNELLFVIRLLARQQYDLKQYTEAEESCNKGLAICLDNLIDDLDEKRKKSALFYEMLGLINEAQRQWDRAQQHYQQAMQVCIDFNERYSQANIYHQLGIIAQEQRQWSQAEQYYRQALQIRIDFDKRYPQIPSYCQLGQLALALEHWDQAEDYYQQALLICNDFRDRYYQASIYHQLGIIAQRQRHWDQAEDYYQQALHIFIDLNDRSNQANTYHQLGMIAQEKGQWDQAEHYYQQALQIDDDFNVRYTKALVYHQLGRLEQEQEHWAQAEHYYQQALQIKKDFDDDYSQASTYYLLGWLEQEQEHWAQAEHYYQMALEIYNDHHALHMQSNIYCNLAVIAQKQQKLVLSEDYYQQALQIKKDSNDEHDLGDIYFDLGMLAIWQDQLVQAEHYYRQALQIYSNFDDRYEQAKIYHELGIVAQRQQQWAQAENYYRQALQINSDFNDRYEQANTYHQLGRLAKDQQQWSQAQQHFQQALQIYNDLDDRHEQAGTYYEMGIVVQQQQQLAKAGDSFLCALEICITYADVKSCHIILCSIAQLWEVNGNTNLLTSIASLLNITSDEAEALLRKMVENKTEEFSN